MSKRRTMSVIVNGALLIQVRVSHTLGKACNTEYGVHQMMYDQTKSLQDLRDVGIMMGKGKSHVQLSIQAPINVCPRLRASLHTTTTIQSPFGVNHAHPQPSDESTSRIGPPCGSDPSRGGLEVSGTKMYVLAATT